MDNLMVSYQQLTKIEDDVTQFHPKTRKERLYREAIIFLHTKAKSSQRNYRKAIEDFFKSTDVDDPEKVKFQDVLLYKEKLRDKELSACTIAFRLSAMRSFFHHLHEEGLIKGNVFTRCSLPKVPKESRACCLTLSQAKTLLSAPDRTTLIGVRDYVILSLLLYNVLRRGAFCSIRVEDFKQDGKHFVLWYTNKGEERVKTKIHPEFVERIRDYISFAREHGINMDGKDYLFLSLGSNNFGDKLTGHGVYQMVKRYAVMTGMNIHPHELRHTGITFALDGGAKIEKVQAMAAHRSIETTLRYYRNKENLDDHGVDYIAKYVKNE